jgi:type IV pilus assembly protein PilP
MANSRLGFRVLFCAGVILAFGACTKPQAEVEGFVARTLLTEPPILEPIPAIKIFPIREYPAGGLRDPFATDDESLTQEQQVQMAADDPDCPDLTRIPEELEGSPLDSLDMVGTMGQGTNYYGLVKDPTGIVHRVQVNNYMGQNYGQILSIAEDKIELEERVKDGSGCERRSQSISLDDNN